MVRMDARTRAEATAAVSYVPGRRRHGDGHLADLASRLFALGAAALAQQHAILLTDGENQHETPAQLDAAIAGAPGDFQCDCRGVGVDWQVAEVRTIATALLGTVDLIADPSTDGRRLRGA